MRLSETSPTPVIPLAVLLRIYISIFQVFSKDEEAALQDYILTCAKMFHGLGTAAVRKLAYEYAVAMNKTMPDGWEKNKRAGEEWLAGFVKRHDDMSLRSPEATSMARAMGFNKPAVDEFFKLYKQALEKHPGITANRIFNLDESGITTVQAVPKVFATKGVKQVGQITAAERGTLVTVCCCVSAAGQALPPVIIFPRVNYREFMIEGAPPGTLGLATQTGWMNGELFIHALRHFIKHMGCSKDNPAILLMDNHESHVSFEVVEIARQNGLSIVTFPPHCSHRLQPLDVSVYGPMKKFYNKAVNEWNVSHAGKRITIYDLPSCFTRAFYQGLTYSNIVEGFRKSGVWPLNSDAFTEADFLPSSVFKARQADSEGTEGESEGAQMSAEDNSEERGMPDSSVPVLPKQLPSTSKDNENDMPGRVGTSSADERQVDATTSPLAVNAVRPFPKTAAVVNSTRKRRKQGTAKLLTCTPERNRLEELRKASEEKKKRKKKASEEQKNRKKKKGKGKEPTSEKVIPPPIEPSSDEDDNIYESDDLSIEGVEEFPPEAECDSDTTKDPIEGDHVLVKLVPENSAQARYYVGKVVEKCDDETFEVTFYRQSVKAPGKFTKPVVEDITNVDREEIMMCLPEPVVGGGTQRMAAILHFPINLDSYHCQ